MRFLPQSFSASSVTLTEVDVRLANSSDLPMIREFYKEIISYLNSKNIQIWDDVYPARCFEEDVASKRFYLCFEKKALACAFVLLESCKGEGAVVWESNGAKSLYLYRLAVRTDLLRSGLGTRAMRIAEDISREKGAQYLRLFVVDFNTPALKMYEKCGYKRAQGEYVDVFDGGVCLTEYGYEIKL